MKVGALREAIGLWRLVREQITAYDRPRAHPLCRWLLIPAVPSTRAAQTTFTLVGRRHARRLADQLHDSAYAGGKLMEAVSRRLAPLEAS